MGVDGFIRRHCYCPPSAGFNKPAEIALAAASGEVFICLSVVIIGAVTSAIRLFLLETAVDRVAYRLRFELFSKIMKNGLADKTSGEMISLLNADVTVMSRILIECSFGIRCVISSIVGTMMVLQMAPLHLISTLLLPIGATFLGAFVFGRFVRKISVAKQESLAKSTSFAEEKLSNLFNVRCYNGEILETRKFEAHMDKVYSLGVKNALAVSGQSCIYYFAAGGFLLNLIYWSGHMISTGVLTLGSMSSLGMYCLMAGASYQGVLRAYGDTQKALGACENVLSIIMSDNNQDTSVSSFNQDTSVSSFNQDTSVSSFNQDTSVSPMPAVSGWTAEMESAPSIRFENVSFHYPPPSGRGNILTNLSFEIPSGARMALLGPSGSGKTTVTLLLMKLLKPTNGQIFVNNSDIQHLNTSWLRAQCGVVSQEPVLFADTLEENVGYGLLTHSAIFQNEDSDVNIRRKNSQRLLENTMKFYNLEDFHKNKILKALKCSYSDEFVDSLPLGVQTLVGKDGTGLSGGQKQRIAIARALCREPKLLLLDEATSALDAQSERQLHSVFKDAVKDRTCLMITHRISTLDFADYVCVLAPHGNGILQFGTRDSVFANPCPLLTQLMCNWQNEKTI
eukprot:GHVL01005809.1.p1 GENE.GHVL01005809.1~~GHVL01005809.1.p1  ORF type:complete len:623 (-),score=119.33 GHVL01005809.1:231-2099(-)